MFSEKFLRRYFFLSETEFNKLQKSLNCVEAVQPRIFYLNFESMIQDLILSALDK